jgi:hypothetical protein
MDKYNVDWSGMDTGFERLWEPDVWHNVLIALSETPLVNFRDAHSHFYQLLDQRCPDVSWVSTQTDGTSRTIFRDARMPWSRTDVIAFSDDGSMSLTAKGIAVLERKVGYCDVLIQAMKKHAENGEYPYTILANAFLDVSLGGFLSFSQIAYGVMRRYRPLVDNLQEALQFSEQDAKQTSSVCTRRLKNMLRLLELVGAIECVKYEFRPCNISVLKLLAGGSSILKHYILPSECAIYLAAIRTKPFILLAGISGTGKSRLVRSLAEATCPENLTDKQKPGNFEMIQVRPNWHDSTELMGYVSRISGKPEYVVTGFVRFLAKAWLFPEAPFFLCLDEMNLAPVEQYFAEFLSVIETRKSTTDELDQPQITTDVLVNLDKNIIEQVLADVFSADWAKPEEHGKVEALKTRFRKDGGIRIPANLVVMGTVNMDETTFSFSRKVLDRAMSFELNGVDLHQGLDPETDGDRETIPANAVLPRFVAGRDVYENNRDLCDKVLAYLVAVNAHLEGTPFKIAYRARNEIMVYVVERTGDGCALQTALDEATALKILPRIEGDEQKIAKSWLDALSSMITEKLVAIAGQSPYPPENEQSVSLDKLRQMTERLEGGYTSFWS